ncbi:MAG: hypothetical protein HY870_21110 [Chloroflexi bacterium]|nr:hypothetical protein [Chloroflexota bacterium]
MKRLKLWLTKIVRAVTNVVFFLAVAFFIGQEYPVPGADETLLARAVGNQYFEFAQWTVEAYTEKAAQIAVPIARYLDDEQRRQFVLDYMQATRDYYDLENRVRQIYAEAAITDPAAVSEDVRARRDALRASIEQRRPTAEAIIQQQISVILIEEGFSVGGEVFPPVAARITPLPNILIISPRDEIKRVTGEALAAGLKVDQAEAIEARVLSDTNQSALVVPIGGLADYPAMILETTELLWLLQTTAHEWSHHWLYLRPLGYSYLSEDGANLRTINETVASVFGDEIGLKVMRRFYRAELQRTFPDLVEEKPLTIPDPEPSQPPTTSAQPRQFSFSRTLRDARIKVDGLLAEARDLKQQGKPDRAEAKIVEAEQYMEAQRQVINANGYHIRKINQAYFAFYGAYADQPGAAGSDPVGPNVIALRVYSPTVREFMDRASAILTLDRLVQAVEELKSQP